MRHRLRMTLRRSRGFTLIEVVLAIAILATVLTLSYRILVNILQTERTVSRKSTPEKIGQAIIALVQKDLLGVIYRHLGESVFHVIDGGETPDAQDRVQFFTTKNPILLELLGGQFETGGSDEYSIGLRGITPVEYSLEANVGTRNASVYTLFRHEFSEWDAADPFNGRRVSYEVYDKVRSLSVECFDGREWWPLWDSRVRLEEEALALEAEQENPQGTINSVTAQLPGSRAPSDTLAEQAAMTPEVLPPAAVPVAVRITIVVLVGDEKGAFTDEAGFGEFKEYKYSAVVPILPAMRIALSSDDELAALGESGLGGLSGDAPGAEGGEDGPPPRRGGPPGGGGPGGDDP